MNKLGHSIAIYMGQVWGTPYRTKPEEKREMTHKKRVLAAAKKRRRLMAKESRRRNRG